MLRGLIIILVSFLNFQAFAENPGSKTFLVLFKSQELQQYHTSLESIEAQFSAFETKTYDGNSELALIIEISSCDFDECFLGDFLVTVNEKESIQLQEIAFRLFDLTENKETLSNYLSLGGTESNPHHKKEKKVATAL
ncbi:MAG: hypothetical protein HWE15_03900 [Algoriphagus sp.]|uniref:hypothetical protein n=1 Tax=Algoriphagus sp. TaxID=1872435 RepID=UPI0017F8E9DF|nr:hypothetical protein [Algoriphagus sp.]NVJ85421.1 hypothetical protein [Algoriphagus sp.]